MLVFFFLLVWEVEFYLVLIKMCILGLLNISDMIVGVFGM